jgi:FKBP12-rapamycin complex-associated protein
MYEALHEGVRTIEVDNWLQVIPQLIARIDTPRPLVGRLIHQVKIFIDKICQNNFWSQFTLSFLS